MDIYHNDQSIKETISSRKPAQNKKHGRCVFKAVYCMDGFMSNYLLCFELKWVNLCN